MTRRGRDLVSFLIKQGIKILPCSLCKTMHEEYNGPLKVSMRIYENVGNDFKIFPSTVFKNTQWRVIKKLLGEASMASAIIKN